MPFHSMSHRNLEFAWAPNARKLSHLLVPFHWQVAVQGLTIRCRKIRPLSKSSRVDMIADSQPTLCSLTMMGLVRRCVYFALQPGLPC